jgi:replicative DNA helicase
MGELALQLATETPVLIVSTEIDSDEGAARLAAQAWRSNHPPTSSPFMPATPSKTTADAILANRAPAEVLRMLDGKPIYILFIEPDCKDPFAAIITRMNEIYAFTQRYPALLVDYLQMLDLSDAEGRRHGVSTVANKLRQLAQHVDIPIVAFSSVSRAFYGQNRKVFEGEEDARTWLAAAKESGDVEYASAVLCYLDTSTTSTDSSGTSPSRLIVAKSRRGRTGFVGLRFDGPTGHFWADDGAVEAMGPKARFGDDEARVLRVVRAAPQGILRSALRKQVHGTRKANVDGALERLLERGELAERPGKLKGGRTVMLIFTSANASA